MKIRNYSIISKSRQQQYRICEIIPTICGVNGISYVQNEKPILMNMSQCTCYKRIMTQSSSNKWTQKDRIRSYSQVIQRPITRKSTRMLTESNQKSPPKYLSLRITARRWCVFQNSNRLLSVNENVKCEVGCLTKLMAIYMVFKLVPDYKLRFMVPYFAENVRGVKADLDSYNYLTVEELLYALILRGGNDALWTLLSGIAEKYYSITQRNLVKQRMLVLFNSYAQELKMNNTRYTNLEGHEDPNNVTTAYDLCLLCDELIKNELFLQILKSTQFSCKAKLEKGDTSTHYTWKNRQLSYLKKGFYGMIGENENSGHCLFLIPQQNLNNTFMILIKTNPNQGIADAQLLAKYQ